jgi:FkbM family methyltransferase
MKLHLAKSILSQFSLSERLLILLDIWLTKLHRAIIADRTLRLFFRDLLLQGAEIRRIGATNLIEVADGPGRRYKFLIRRRTSDALAAQQVLFEREYEPLVQLIARKQGNSAVRSIVDAGANAGYATIYLLSHYPKAKCFAIEPDPNNFEALKTNIEANGFQNVFPLQAALWRANENLVVSRDFRDGAQWSLRVQRPEREVGARLVRGMTLPQIMEDLQITEIDILKVDIEGAEAEVFDAGAGAERLLPQVKFLAIELHAETGRSEDILKVLDDNDFEMHLAGQTHIGFNRSFF